MQNSSNNGAQADNEKQAHDAEKGRQRNTIQRDMIMVESDYKKYANEKNTLDMEIRALKKDEAQIKISLHEKQERLSKAEYELVQLDVALKGLKKKLNSV